MSIWYRAHRSANAEEVFSGLGGLFSSGRWNYLGNKSIYGSESIALCTLEWLSHHGLSVSGFSYYRYSFEIPAKLIAQFSVAKLPRHWDAVPATDLTRTFADKHLFARSKVLAMVVPSVVVPEEKNIVINPLHDAFADVMKSVKNLGKYVGPTR
jgi:RES domain-containing protein